MKYTVILLFLLFPFFLVAQLHIPAASPPAKSTQKVGYTTLEIEYHRPNVKARKIFGELIPYGNVWRNGANQATLLRFDRKVRIGDTDIAPGTYSFYAVPGALSWVFILNRDTTLWGSRGFDKTKNVVEWSTTQRKMSERVESLEFRWMNITPQSVDLVLEWEYTKVVLPIQLATDEQVMTHIKEELGPKSNGGDYYKAARYYLDNNLDLRQAQKWMDKRVELDGDQFGILRYKAIIEKKLGLEEEAKSTMQLSLKLAEEKQNNHYIRMNRRSLKNWSRTAASISSQELLEKSIAYHDPKGQWFQDSILAFPLYEERPNGSYRVTDLQIGPQLGVFHMYQRRGQHMITRSLSPDHCETLFNWSRTFSDKEAEQYRLNCDFTKVMQDYYSYLWGMPMKLRDPGTIIDPKVYIRDFFGEELLELKVNYDPEVGGDIWYFYFDPATYAMKGYRFYHDEAKNDGEYILLSGEERVKDMRIPKKREWYTHKDRRFLGFDLLLPPEPIRQMNTFE